MDTGLELPVKHNVIYKLNRPLKENEIMGITCHLLSLYMMYTQGQLLSNTIYTCTLLHEKELNCDIQLPVILILRAASLSRQLVMSCGLVLEEDFSLESFGLSFFDDVDYSLISKEVSRILKESLSKPYCHILLLLKTYCNLLLECMTMDILKIQTWIELCLKYSHLCRNELLQNEELNSIWETFFDSDITRNILYGQMPPRASHKMNIQDALNHFDTLLNEMKMVVSYALDPHPQLMDYILLYTLNHPNSNPISKCFLMNFIFQQGNLLCGFYDPLYVIYVQWSDFKNLSTFVLQEEFESPLTPCPSQNLKSLFTDILKFFGSNTSRQYRNMDKLFIQVNQAYQCVIYTSFMYTYL